MQANGRHAGVGLLWSVCYEEQGVSGFGASDSVDSLARFVCEDFGERRFPTEVVLHTRKGNAGNAVGLCKRCERVHHLATQRVAIGNAQALHNAAFGDNAFKDFEAAFGGRLGDFAELKVEPEVGLIAAVFLHRFFVGHAKERRWNVNIESVLPNLGEHAFDHCLKLLFFDEGHLNVDLREFGLPVLAKIFVAEATRDLEVALEARDHEELLVNLRRLGECVKRTRVEAGRHHEVACATRRVLHHKWRLDFVEAVVSKIRANCLAGLGARAKFLLQLGASQVEVTILKSQRFVGLDAIFNQKGRGIGLGENLKLVGVNLDAAGFHVGIVLATAGVHRADDSNAELAAQLAGLFKGFFVHGWIKDDLGESIAIAKVDKDTTTVVSAIVDPSG